MQSRDTSLLREVSDIVTRILELSQEIKTDDDLFDLGMTSMKFVEVIMEIEDAFKIRIKDEYLLPQLFMTVGNVTEILEKHLQQE